MPHLNAQARLDDDLGELQQRHHKQKPAVNDRVKQQRFLHGMTPGMTAQKRQNTSGTQVTSMSNKTFVSRFRVDGGSKPSAAGK